LFSRQEPSPCTLFEKILSLLNWSYWKDIETAGISGASAHDFSPAAFDLGPLSSGFAGK
jgi:hypothetical protein